MFLNKNSVLFYPYYRYVGKEVFVGGAKEVLLNGIREKLLKYYNMWVMLFLEHYLIIINDTHMEELMRYSIQYKN